MTTVYADNNATITAVKAATMEGLFSTPHRKPPRIVWVEDDQYLCQMLEVVIREHLKEVELLFFENGDDAWRDLCRERPALFATDCMHPGLPGPEILRKLAKQEATFPIIWSCGCGGGWHEEKEDLSRLRLFLLPKPYRISQLMERLNEALRPCENASFQKEIHANRDECDQRLALHRKAPGDA